MTTPLWSKWGRSSTLKTYFLSLPLYYNNKQLTDYVNDPGMCYLKLLNFVLFCFKCALSSCKQDFWIFGARCNRVGLLYRLSRFIEVGHAHALSLSLAQVALYVSLGFLKKIIDFFVDFHLHQKTYHRQHCGRCCFFSSSTLFNIAAHHCVSLLFFTFYI